MALVEQNFPSPGVALLNARVTTPASGGSRLAQMQARFQQKQMQEKEQKLLRLYESQQQRAFQRVGRGGSGSSTSSTTSTTSLGGGKVRSLFEERRAVKPGAPGWDRSYPLEPLDAAKTTKTNKAARGASLDRANQQAKTTVRRSKSHARVGANNVNSADADYSVYRKHSLNTTETDLRKQSHNNPVGADFNTTFRKQPRATNGELNGTFIKQHNINNSAEADFNGGYRKPEHNNRNYKQEYEEEDINYERLGEDVHLNENFTVLHEKRQEELFNKYQVHDVDNTDFLPDSPPPEFYNDELDDSFVFKKLPNVGGTPLIEDVAKNGDKFKTYNATKSNRGEEKKRMTPPASEPKRGPPRRRAQEDESPPARGAPKPAVRRIETKVISPSPAATAPAADRRSSPSAKRSSGVQSKSSPTVAMQKKSVQAGQSRQPVSPRTPLAAVNKDLAQCRFCKRSFATDRIQTHENICTKTTQKKRKEYDAVKHRVAGTEAEVFVKRALKQGPATQKKQPEPKKADWRKKHEEFINTIRAAKEMKAHLAAGGKVSDLPPPPPLDTSDYIQCPHCQRRFNEAAAERHIPRCATMLHNKPKASTPNKSAVPQTSGARKR